MKENDIKGKDNVIAVVGASREHYKYGFKVFYTLLVNGFNVYPVNPNADFIAGKKCYASIRDIPEKPDIVITVTKPEVTEKIIDDLKGMKIKVFWMQPGSESKGAIEKCKKLNINYSAGKCYIKDELKIDFAVIE
ncbi:MAG: CoA-binding protein [Candidatus Anstonellales archaeon]